MCGFPGQRWRHFSRRDSDAGIGWKARGVLVWRGAREWRGAILAVNTPKNKPGIQARGPHSTCPRCRACLRSQAINYDRGPALRGLLPDYLGGACADLCHHPAGDPARALHGRSDRGDRLDRGPIRCRLSLADTFLLLERGHPPRLQGLAVCHLCLRQCPVHLVRRGHVAALLVRAGRSRNSWAGAHSSGFTSRCC